MNIAIMCSGGDAAGMNPAIKSFVENCLKIDIILAVNCEKEECLIEG